MLQDTALGKNVKDGHASPHTDDVFLHIGNPFSRTIVDVVNDAEIHL